MITSVVQANSCSRNGTAIHRCPDCPSTYIVSALRVRQLMVSLAVVSAIRSNAHRTCRMRGSRTPDMRVIIQAVVPTKQQRTTKLQLKVRWVRSVKRRSRPLLVIYAFDASVSNYACHPIIDGLLYTQQDYATLMLCYQDTYVWDVAKQLRSYILAS